MELENSICDTIFVCVCSFELILDNNLANPLYMDEHHFVFLLSICKYSFSQPAAEYVLTLIKNKPVLTAHFPVLV